MIILFISYIGHHQSYLNESCNKTLSPFSHKRQVFVFAVWNLVMYFYTIYLNPASIWNDVTEYMSFTCFKKSWIASSLFPFNDGFQNKTFILNTNGRIIDSNLEKCKYLSNAVGYDHDSKCVWKSISWRF